jgi:hypothetical protein
MFGLFPLCQGIASQLASGLIRADSDPVYLLVFAGSRCRPPVRPMTTVLPTVKYGTEVL